MISFIGTLKYKRCFLSYSACCWQNCFH